MEDFFSQVFDIVLWSAFWLGVIKVLEVLLALRKHHASMSNLQEEIGERLEAVLHNVNEEIHEGIHYWFDADDDCFLAQGASLSGVREHLKARFTDDIFIVKERFVFVGPDFEGEDLENDDAASKYVAKVMLQRAGIQINEN
jgi:hypothetical protein